MNLLGMQGMVFDKLDIYLVVLVVLIMCVIFKLKPSFPTIQSIQTTVELLNTKGGIIALLGTFTMIFFFTGLKFMYWSADMIKTGKIDPNNAIIISGFNWITGIAFGGVFGAMIKTMTGESPPSSSTTVSTTSAPNSPPAQISTTISTQPSVTSTDPTPSEPPATGPIQVSIGK